METVPETFKCTHWTFDTDEQVCFLKYSNGGLRNIDTDAGDRTISGNRACGCERMENIEYIGTDIEIENKPTISPETCADWCVLSISSGNTIIQRNV